MGEASMCLAEWVVNIVGINPVRTTLSVILSHHANAHETASNYPTSASSEMNTIFNSISMADSAQRTFVYLTYYLIFFLINFSEMAVVSFSMTMVYVKTRRLQHTRISENKRFVGETYID